MKNQIITMVGVTLLAVGCGASAGVPVQKLADAEAANRSARELGADKQTAAQLNLKLADEEIASAKAAIKDGDNRRAEYLLLRAKADAELAVALAHEQNAKTETGKVVESANEKQKANANANANGGQ